MRGELHVAEYAQIDDWMGVAQFLANEQYRRSGAYQRVTDDLARRPPVELLSTLEQGLQTTHCKCKKKNPGRRAATKPILVF